MTNDYNDGLRFNVSSGKRFMLFICVTALCLIVGSIVAGLVIYFGKSPAALRIGTVLQDILIFIVPAVVTAVLITRQPADFLCLRRQTSGVIFLLVTAIAIISIPAMNTIINWNEGIQLPDALQPIEQWMRAMEDSAKEVTDTLIGTPGAGGLIIAVVIVGLLAGFSEELFFRGCLQRILSTSGMNIHCAIWVTAIVFSSVHMQFFGFFPRLLLGAYFGYLLAWSRSIWLPMFAHALNNTMAVITYRMDKAMDVDLNSFANGESAGDITLIIASAVFVAGLLRIVYKKSVG